MIFALCHTCTECCASDGKDQANGKEVNRRRCPQTNAQSHGLCFPERVLHVAAAIGIERWAAGTSAAAAIDLAATLTKQQAVFVNNENTFSEFQFRRPIVANVFEPKVSIARVRRPHLSSSDDLFMRIDFCSKFDGVLQPSDRMPIDVSFVLDISGR